MNRNPLPGLSPLWLISLALVLGCAIVVMIPAAIATGDPIKSSDWIGFAGNVVSGAMTILAAAIAWHAVQKQIVVQQDIAAGQISAQRILIIQDRLAILTDDERLVWNLRVAVGIFAKIPPIYLSVPQPSVDACTAAEEKFGECQEKLQEITTAIEIAGARRHSVAIGLIERSQVLIEEARFSQDIVEIRRKLHSTRAALQRSNAGIRTDIEHALSYPDVMPSLADGIKCVDEAVDDYLRSVRSEILRLNRLLKDSAEVVGL